MVTPDVEAFAPPSAMMDYKTREKEVYAIVIAESLINHSREATKGGIGLYYEDAVDDTLALIPTSELEKPEYNPNPALLRIMSFWREKIDKAGIAAVDELPEGAERTYLNLLLWAENLHPSEFVVMLRDGDEGVPMSRTDPKAGLMNKARILIKKRILIDLLDDMRMLRSQTPTGGQDDMEMAGPEMDKIAKDWAGKVKKVRKKREETPPPPPVQDGE